MIHGEAFQRFAKDAPICVMGQMVLEHTLPPATVDGIIESDAEWQYTQDLLFPDVVHPNSSINSAFNKMSEVDPIV